MSSCIRSLEWCDGPQEPQAIFSFLTNQCEFCKKVQSDFQKETEENA